MRRPFGVCESALAAAAFAAFELEELARTRPAADAAALPVCLWFFAITHHLLPASVLAADPVMAETPGATQ